MNNRITDTIKHLIIINVIFFIAVKVVGLNLYDQLAIWFPENDHFKVWQVFTHMFMHHPTFYLHIIMNMFGLWMFGTPLEQKWGKKKFLFFYFSAGLGAVLLPWAIDFYQFNSLVEKLVANGFNKLEVLSILNEGKYNTGWENILSSQGLDTLTTIFYTKSVGASGAIMGLLAAFGINFPDSKLALIFLPIPIAAKYFIPVLLGYEMLSGIFGWSSVFGINVAHFAHLGGAIVGGLIAWYWKKNQFKIN
ncbi:rhomboid family intramembrane serine protease [Polaribacter batillariae]|uniref:Rhomboid family intramembrane serine protease n=1 Tax=Polaribacter batillariae TaxID=2808900 RepID=A0ABX7SV62_9FLAO|nr:rhomboid family intramembrane serine protease [Polaribacter batillariae]QTD38125.1 rhomboid family intramembrane serine protease [Polaribacter batillariae]